jgi:hypothetical protein
MEMGRGKRRMERHKTAVPADDTSTSFPSFILSFIVPSCYALLAPILRPFWLSSVRLVEITYEAYGHLSVLLFILLPAHLSFLTALRACCAS